MYANNSKANSLNSDIAYAYWNEICDIEPLSAEEEKRLINLIKAGDKVAYDNFVEAYLRLVVSRAKKYCHDFDSFMDMVQEGNIGLMCAIERFDPDRGCRFSTYAQAWIDKYIRRESCRTGCPIHIPEKTTGHINRLLITTARFVQENQREPSPEELAEILNMKVERVLELQLIINPTLSLEKEYDYSSTPQPLINKIPDHNTLTPEETFFEKDKKNILINLMKENLSEIEFKVLLLRFGFSESGEPQTLFSVSEECGITKEGVRKAEMRAIKKLHKAIISSGLTQVDLV